MVSDFHMAFNFLYVSDYIQQKCAYKIMRMNRLAAQGKEKTHIGHKRPKICGSQGYDRWSKQAAIAALDKYESTIGGRQQHSGWGTMWQARRSQIQDSMR